MANAIALLPRGSTELATLASSYSHQLAVVDPAWGLFPNARPHCYDEPTAGVPPEAECRRLEQELTRALEPAGQELAAHAAALIVDGYPQKDASTATYVHHLVRRLAEAPADLLSEIVDAVIDANPKFRPGAGAVGAVVKERLAARRVLLRQVQACLRYHAHRRMLAEREKDLMVPITVALLERIRGEPTGRSAMPEPERPRIKPRYFTREQLNALRSAKPQSP